MHNQQILVVSAGVQNWSIHFLVVVVVVVDVVVVFVVRLNW